MFVAQMGLGMTAAQKGLGKSKRRHARQRQLPSTTLGLGQLQQPTAFRDA